MLAHPKHEVVLLVAGSFAPSATRRTCCGCGRLGSGGWRSRLDHAGNSLNQCGEAVQVSDADHCLLPGEDVQRGGALGPVDVEIAAQVLDPMDGLKCLLKGVKLASSSGGSKSHTNNEAGDLHDLPPIGYCAFLTLKLPPVF